LHEKTTFAFFYFIFHKDEIANETANEIVNEVDNEVVNEDVFEVVK